MTATLPAGPQELPAVQYSTCPAVELTALSAVIPYCSGSPLYTWHCVVSQIDPVNETRATATLRAATA